MSSINAVILAVASKAQQKKQKTAAKVAVEASLEADRKAKCLLFEKEHRINTKYDLVTPPTKPLRNNGNRGGAVIITGDYVFVTSDLSPGKCSHGGNGYVIDFEGTGPDRKFTIQYDRCSISGMKMERNVEYHRITQIPNPAFELTTLTRKRKATTSPDTSISSESTSESTIFEEEPLDVILERGWRRNRGKGWRAKDLGVFPKNMEVKRTSLHDELFRQDLRELKGYLRAKGTGATNNKQNDHHRKRDGTFASKYKKSKPLSISFLNFAWGVNKNYANRLVNQKPPEPTKANDESTIYTTSIIIESCLCGCGRGVVQAKVVLH
jgi:hypothetical protein